MAPGILVPPGRVCNLGALPLAPPSPSAICCWPLVLSRRPGPRGAALQRRRGSFCARILLCMGQLDHLVGHAALRANRVHTILYHECASCAVLIAEFCTTYGWSVFPSTVICTKAGRAIPSTIFFADGCTILLPILCADAGWTVLPSRFLPVIPPMQARIVRARNLFFVGQLLYHLPRHIACAEAVLLLVTLVCAGLGRY